MRLSIEAECFKSEFRLLCLSYNLGLGFQIRVRVDILHAKVNLGFDVRIGVEALRPGGFSPSMPCQEQQQQQD